VGVGFPEGPFKRLVQLFAVNGGRQLFGVCHLAVRPDSVSIPVSISSGYRDSLRSKFVLRGSYHQATSESIPEDRLPFGKTPEGSSDRPSRIVDFGIVKPQGI